MFPETFIFLFAHGFFRSGNKSKLLLAIPVEENWCFVTQHIKDVAQPFVSVRDKKKIEMVKLIILIEDIYLLLRKMIVLWNILSLRWELLVETVKVNF